MLESEFPARRTLYNQIKKSAKKASRKHLDLLLDQLTWLESLPDSDALLDGIPVTKLIYMAGMASALDASDMKDLLPAKRYTLILALIRQMRVKARDDVAEMFIRRIGAIHKTAREELQVIQARQRELSEELVATLEQVLEILAENLDDASTGQRVRDLLAPHGNLDQLTMDCEAIRVWSGGNHLPLVWKAFSSWRAAMFRMAKALRPCRRCCRRKTPTSEWPCRGGGSRLVRARWLRSPSPRPGSWPASQCPPSGHSRVLRC